METPVLGVSADHEGDSEASIILFEPSDKVYSFLEMTGYVHVSDPDLPGPEYDIPKHKAFTAQPTGAETRVAWERSYEMFRQQRIDVCGLDLEPFESPQN